MMTRPYDFRIAPHDAAAVVRGYYVYAWMRGEQWLYIGCSRAVGSRFHPGHVIRKGFAFGDEFRLWVCASYPVMRHLEHELIKEYRPVLNTTYETRRPYSPRKAAAALPRKETTMARWWYYTIIKCPGCGATDSQYDASAPWCDSGLSGAPVIKELCEECAAEEKEEESDMERARR